MKFCNYCHDEIRDVEYVSKNDSTEYYHIGCFADMNDVTLLEDNE